jgi:hypothetical protein
MILNKKYKNIYCIKINIFSFGRKTAFSFGRKTAFFIAKIPRLKILNSFQNI